MIFSSLLLKCSTSPTKNENSIYNYGLLFSQNHHLPIDSFYLYDQSGLGKDICRYFLVVKRPPKALASVRGDFDFDWRSSRRGKHMI